MTRSFNFADLIEIVCAAVPDRTAIICGDKQLTFQELDHRASQLAGGLSRLGIGKGDHVGLYLYNCSEYLEAMLACFKLRAVPINVNYRYVGDELRYVFNNADMRGVIYGSDFSSLVEEVMADCPTLEHRITVGSQASGAELEYETLLENGDASLAAQERSDDDIFMLYTGGTTGMPKGVMWPHYALFMAALGGLGIGHPDGPIATPEEAGQRAIDGFGAKILILAPLMHGSAWWAACLMLMSGNTVVLNEQRSLNGEHVWDLVAKHQINGISIVGDAMAIPMIEALDANPDRWDLSSVFRMSSGGAMFSDAQQEALKKYIPVLEIRNSFGSSESGSMGWAEARDGKSDGALGRVIRTEFMDVLIQDADGNWQHTTPGAGTEGIMARSGHIPVGYYNAPEKTRETFVTVDGTRWILTGDAAILEDDETITVLGRGSNCINTGGEKVFPEEVEAALKQHKDIRDALVVATPDERFTNRITAVISCANGSSPDLEGVQAHCREHIAGYKVPRQLVIVPEVPRSPSGKPDYATALELATQ